MKLGLLEICCLYDDDDDDDDDDEFRFNDSSTQEGLSRQNGILIFF